MHVQTCTETQQQKHTLPLTSENMAEEADNRHATNEREKIMEKSLACQRTEIFAQFNDILLQFASNSGESSM